jgi:hypothetical protein
MKDFFNKNKMLLGGIVVAVILVWVYFTYFSGSSEALLSETQSASPVSQELLVTLSNLHTLRLDETIFQDPVFVSLSDFGVTIPPETVGRRNPFAPYVGSVGTSSIKAPTKTQ